MSIGTSCGWSADRDARRPRQGLFQAGAVSPGQSSPLTGSQQKLKKKKKKRSIKKTSWKSTCSLWFYVLRLSSLDVVVFSWRGNGGTKQGACPLFYDLFRDSFGRRQREIANQKQERVGLCWMQKQHTQTHNTGRPVCDVWGDTYDGTAASHWTRSSPWVSLGYWTFFLLFFCPSGLFACKWVFRLLTGYAIVSAGWCQMATSCCLPETNSRWANRGLNTRCII